MPRKHPDTERVSGPAPPMKTASIPRSRASAVNDRKTARAECTPRFRAAAVNAIRATRATRSSRAIGLPLLAPNTHLLAETGNAV
jgi:hypothetical protein